MISNLLSKKPSIIPSSFKLDPYPKSSGSSVPLFTDALTRLPENNKLIEGAIDVLEYLKPKYRLFIITNGFRDVQQKKLINSRIKHYFEGVYDSESVGVKKPDPKIFIHALEDSISKANESLMIGDNYEADILGAKKLNIQTIHFVAHGEEIQNKNETIHKLIELKAIL